MFEAVFLIISPGVLCVVALVLALACYYRANYKSAVHSLKNSEQLINNLQEGVYRSSLDGRQLSANPALVKINGYDTESELLKAVEDIAVEWYVDPNRRDEFSRILFENGQVTDFVSEIYRHKTRERIWISENANLIWHPRTGKPLHFEGTVRDISDTIARNKSEVLLKNLTDQLPTGLFQLVRSPDRRFTCPYVSKRFRELEDLAEDEEFHADIFVRKIHSDDLNGYLKSLKDSRKYKVAWDHEFRMQTPRGTMEWCRIQANPEFKEDGTVIWYGQLTNINEHRIAQERVNRLAYYDSLTGLPNRTNFVTQLKNRLQNKFVKDSYSAVCFIDLDNFKFLNDSHGHNFGDRLLTGIAERLLENLNGSAILSRFGGDEFVLLLNDLGADQALANQNAEKVTNRLLEAIRRGFVIDGKDCSTSISMGIVIFRVTGSVDAEELLKSADIAMYEAKKRGRDGFVLYDSDTLKTVTENYGLQRDIQVAVKQNQFLLELQPQVDNNGRIKSAEVLARWNHPERGRIMPGQFIALAEQTGQIYHLNEWVLEQTAKIISQWQEDPQLKDVRLSVNISPRQMLDSGFISRTGELLAKYRIKPGHLVIELTEHVMARNPDLVEKSMKRLKNAGIEFSLDDFGTGYSSISQLRQFPFDELKIDGSFVADIGNQEEVRTLVKAILNMADALGLKTVAEHVTSTDQLELLKSLNCDLYQGYLFSPALSVTDFEHLVQVHSPKTSVVDGQGKNVTAL
ncbi:MAG: sensor domain-containing protein [Rhizobiaceae bacterium]